jgi:hypothetical protein
LEGEELANAIDKANPLSDSDFDGAMIEMASQHMNTFLQRIIGGTHGPRLLAACNVLNQTLHLKHLRKECRRHERLLAKLAQIVQGTDLELAEMACQLFSHILIEESAAHRQVFVDLRPRLLALNRQGSKFALRSLILMFPASRSFFISEGGVPVPVEHKPCGNPSCGLVERAGGLKFKQCAGCKIVYYHTGEYQKANWKRHKPTCKKINIK